MITEFLNKYQINDEAIAVGVSGGADSLALVLMMNEELKPIGKKVIALTVNHGLREEAGNEAQYVAKLMSDFDIEHHILIWEGKKPESGIEESARIARYNLLTEWCCQNNVKTLAIAHHLLDQAETFFMRLERGSGLTGLCGMMPISEMNGLTIIRPLLECEPSLLKNYLNTHGIKWVEDPSNQSDNFLRVRVRKFMPVLKDMLGVDAARIANTMLILSRTKNYMEEQTAKFIKNYVRYWDKAGVSFSLKTFQEQHEEMCYRVLSFLIKEVGNNVYTPRSEDVQRLYNRILHNKFGGIEFDTVKLDEVMEIRQNMTENQFKGATLGGCEIFVFQGKIWIVPELKGRVKLSKKDWELFVTDNPQFAKCKLPYKLRLSLYKSS